MQTVRKAFRVKLELLGLKARLALLDQQARKGYREIPELLEQMVQTV